MSKLYQKGLDVKNDTIHRFPLVLKTGQQKIVIPEGAEFLTIDFLGNMVVLWALMNPFNKKEERFIEIFQTDSALPGVISEKIEYVYISTFKQEKSQAAFHAFEVIKFIL